MGEISNKTFRENRKCRICGVPLSIYNPNIICFSHSQPHDETIDIPDDERNCPNRSWDIIQLQFDYHGYFKED